MGRKVKYSKELKLEIVKRYLNGESAISLANEYGMIKRVDDSIYRWVHRYESHGESVYFLLTSANVISPPLFWYITVFFTAPFWCFIKILSQLIIEFN